MKNNVCKRLAATAAALALTLGGLGAPIADTGMAGFGISASATPPPGSQPVTYYTDGDFRYTVENGAATITYYTGNEKNVTIPETVGDGIKVKAIGRRSFWNSSITGIKLPDTVQIVEDSAFLGCKYLKYVKLSARLQRICDYAFSQCAITSIKLPKGLFTIDDHAFFGCEGLTEITLTRCVETVAATAFRDCVNLKAINVESDNPRLASSDGIMYNKDLSELMLCPEGKDSFDIPESCTKIGESAFTNNKSITSFAIPESITEIGDEAFMSTGLTEITVPENITSLGKNVFRDCRDLKTADVRSKASQIAYGMFQNCRSLESVSVPEGTEIINVLAFSDCVSLKSITLPEGVKTIADQAFDGYRNLEKAVIPDGVEEIGVWAFLSCKRLRTVVVPASVGKLGYRAFGYYYDPSVAARYSKYDNFTMICAKDSVVEQYAKENRFRCGYAVTEMNPAFTVQATNTRLKIDWQPVEGAEKYAVAQYIDGKWQILAQGTETSYIMKGLEPMTNYRIAVAAKFNGEWNMELSNAMTVSTLHIYPELTAKKIDGRYYLRWTAVPGAEKYGIAICRDSSKWKLVAETDADVLEYKISSNTKISGSYWVSICAMIDGKWDTSKIGERDKLIFID